MSYALDVRAQSAQIFIYDDVGRDGYGYGLDSLQRDLRGFRGPRLDVAIHSGGGNLAEALGIAAHLKSLPTTIRTHATLAASAATVIYLAGSERTISPYGSLMVHAPTLGDVSGNASDFETAAATLRQFSDLLVAIYADATGGSLSYWRGAVEAETWYGAAEAVSVGLAHRIADRPMSAAPAAMLQAVAKAAAQRDEIRTAVLAALDAFEERIAARVDAEMCRPENLALLERIFGR